MGDQLHMAFSRQKYFKLVEREHLQQVLDEMDLAKALDFDSKVAIKTDKPLPASVLVLAKVRKSAAGYDLYVKMVRVQTGEVVSASMMKIDSKLVE
jgi:curli biogenesis system outer membrane secretion channel CsgG